MSAGRYEIRLCGNPDCQLRYPEIEGHPFGAFCPRCGEGTQIVLTRELILEGEKQVQSKATAPFSALLENVRSAWNVGSIIRTSESVGVRHLYLGGITPSPSSKKVLKTSLGAERGVSWSHHNNSLQLVEKLKGQGQIIWALESAPQSLSIFEAVKKLSSDPVLLVVGNEVCGIDPDILQLSDQLVSIPMQGIKKSLNVAVAFGIATALLANLT